MPAKIGTAEVDVVLNRRLLATDLDKAGREVGARMGASGRAAGAKLGKETVTGFRAEISKAKGAETGALSSGLVAAGSAAAVWSLTSAASDLNETVSQSSQIFGASSQQLDRWGDTAADSFGQSKRAAIEAANGFGLFFTNAGKSGAEAEEMSRKLVELASDAASFKNTAPEQAVEAFGAALRGESEPIRQYGVMLDDFTLKQRAYNMGLTESTSGVLPPQIRMQAAYAEILEQTSTIQGDFARTSGGAANQQRILAAEFENTKAALGSGLLPAMTGGLKGVNGFMGGFNHLPPVLQQTALFGVSGGLIWLKYGDTLTSVGGKAVDLAKNLIVPTRAVEGIGKAADSSSSALDGTGASIAGVAVAGASLIGLAQSVRSAQDDAADSAVAMFDQFTGGSRFDEAKGTFADLQEELARTADHLGYVRQEADNALNPLTKQGLNQLAGGMEQYQGQLQQTADDARALAKAHDISTTEALRYGDEAGYAASLVDKGIRERALPTLDELRNSWSDVRKEAQGAKDDFRKAFDIGMDPQQAAIDANQAAVDVGKSIRENGPNFDISTEAGRKNREEYLQGRNAILDYAQALIDSGTPLDEVKRKTEVLIIGLAQQAKAAGATDDQVKALNDEMNLTPDRIDVAFSTPGLDTAIAKTRELNAQTYLLLALQHQQEEDAARRNRLSRDYGITINGDDLTPHGRSNASGGLHVHGNVNVDAKDKPASEVGNAIVRDVASRHR